MHTWPAALQNHLANRRVRTTTELLQVVRPSDGAAVGLTRFCRTLPYDHGDGLGAINYLPAPGAGLSALKRSAGFAPDTLEVDLLIDGTVLTENDILAGLWAAAAWRLILVDYTDLSPGSGGEEGAGWVSDIAISGKAATAKLRSLREKYLTRDIRVVKSACGWRFGRPEADGSERCGARRAVPFWAPLATVAATDARDAKIGDIVKAASFDDRYYWCVLGGDTDAGEPAFDTTLDAITTETGGVQWLTQRALTIPATVATVVEPGRVFTVTVATDAPDGFFALGFCNWTGGDNIPFGRDVKAWTLSSKTVELYEPTPRAIEIGDNLDLLAGCDRSRAACKTFRNIENRFGFTDAPLNDRVYRIVEV